MAVSGMWLFSIPRAEAQTITGGLNPISTTTKDVN